MRLILALTALLATGLGIKFYFGDSDGLAVQTATSPKRIQTSILNTEGKEIGQAVMLQTRHGVLIHIDARGLSPGWHGVHIHETGICEAPGFESAGGHFNPDKKKHGYDHPQGYHAGDLPNVYVNDSGELHAELFTDRITLEADKDHSVLRSGGTSLMIHEGPDDYQSDPSGMSGGRVACGVIGHTT